MVASSITAKSTSIDDAEDETSASATVANKEVRFRQNSPTSSSGLVRGESKTQEFSGASNSGAAIFSSIRAVWDHKRVQQENHYRRIIFPWNKYYKTWWGFTVFAAVFTIFFETYQIAFVPAGLYPYNDAFSVIEYILVSVFVVDIGVNFNLAFYNEKGDIVCERQLIARNYLRFMFWVDLVGVFPFYVIALACTGQLGQDSALAQYLALFRLFRMVRMYRLKQLFDILQYSTKISLMWLTLTRNFSAALAWTHFAACIMYFIARQYSFDEDETWIGGSLTGLNAVERYLTSLYWSVVTFTTVGYGDFSPVNAAEQIWGMIYMLLNIILQSWIIGSITLLIVKHDEQTGEYRDTLKVLNQYSSMHSFDESLQKHLKTQIKLDFNNREISDEQVLRHFPSSVRRKVLRRLYLPSLMQTSLMNDVRQQFVDAFLAACNVEIFSPREEILQRGSVSSDLYLLVGGAVELLPWDSSSSTVGTSEEVGPFGSITDSELQPEHGVSARQLNAGDFINEIGFFTESPQIETVRTVAVCKTLTMSRQAYKMIAQDHPGSAGKILHNLLTKVEKMRAEIRSEPRVNLPKRLEVLRAGSEYDTSNDGSSSHYAEVHQTVTSVQTKAALTAIQDLVKMHISKQKDDHTTRFLFAASRGDTSTITLMCDQGFDPNSADYDFRTALMVAAVKGNTETITKLLEYQANPNLVDMHGSSALYEAARNGHETTMAELLKHGAQLCMDESQAASTLCQAVFTGDVLTLRRLLRAQIQVNASDYDKRTAAHIAAAEGNVAALKVLVEFGADVTAKDRWNNTIHDEAKRANAIQLLEYLKTLKTGT